MQCIICGKRLNVFGSRKLQLCSTHYLEHRKNKRLTVRKEVMDAIKSQEKIKSRLIANIENYQQKIRVLKAKHPKSYKNPKSTLSLHYNIVDRMTKELIEINSVIEDLHKKLKQ